MSCPREKCRGRAIKECSGRARAAQGGTGWKVCVERGEVRGEVGITVISMVGFHRFSYSASGNRHGVRYRKMTQLMYRAQLGHRIQPKMGPGAKNGTTVLGLTNNSKRTNLLNII